MTLDFSNDETYTKETVLANVRYAVFDPKSLREDALFAAFLDMAVTFALMDYSNPDRPRYKIIDAVDMVSLDIRLEEIMEAGKIVANYDRGWDIYPTTKEAEMALCILLNRHN